MIAKTTSDKIMLQDVASIMMVNICVVVAKVKRLIEYSQVW